MKFVLLDKFIGLLLFAIAGYEIVAIFRPRYRFQYRKSGRAVGLLVSVGSAMMLLAFGSVFFMDPGPDETVPRILGVPILVGFCLCVIGRLTD